jgi:hypothetical protein
MAKRGIVRRWVAAWPGAAAIGILNGAIREGTYGRRIEAERANRLSGVTLVAGLALYFWNLNRRWPIPSRTDAAKIGASWVTLTVVFEFGFGRAIEKRSWSEMLQAYNIAEGETWPAVLAWIAVGPGVVRGLQVH